MIDNVLDIIRNLNSGSIIPNQKDDITKIDIQSDIVELYRDISCKKIKYYYLAKFELDEENGDNMSMIESEIMKAENYERPNPSDSYMILFLKVEDINESLYPRIIQIEENEFFYKKYVFYYTEKEKKSFCEWCSSLEESGKPTLDEVLINAQNLDDDSEQIGFLTRLLSKVPFFDPVFPKAIMSDFNNMVEQRIKGIRKNRDNIEMINKLFIESVEGDDFDTELLTQKIYENLMEE